MTPTRTCLVLLPLATLVGAALPASAGPAAAVLETSDATVYEGDSGTTALVFQVRRVSGFTGQAVTVTWSTADGTATAGSDYTSAAGSLTFDKKNAVRQVVVLVTGDTAQEPDEHLFVRLSQSGGGDGEGHGTVLNDDGWPVDGG